MRQTNIFWAAIFLGALEVVRTFKPVETVSSSNDSKSWKGVATATFQQYQKGEIHDLPLCEAELYGMCVFYIYRL